MEIKTVKVEGWNDEWKNAITDELDQYVLENHLPSLEYGSGTYICDYSDNIKVIRFPGATRGRIVLDLENTITDIELYNDEMARAVQCYKPEAYDVVKKYIGSKLVFV